MIHYTKHRIFLLLVIVVLLSISISLYQLADRKYSAHRQNFNGFSKVVVRHNKSNTMMASLFTRSNGGSISPQCENIVTISNEIDKPQEKILEKNIVYRDNCDFFINQISPSLVWVTENTIQVTFSINSTAMRGRDVFLRKKPSDFDVSVIFNAN